MLSKQHVKAFTLIETLLVLAIIAFGLVILHLQPSDKLMANIESRIFFDQLASELTFAHERSIIEGQNVRVVFHPANDAVLFHLPKSNEYYQTLEIPAPWQTASQFNLYYLPDGRISSFQKVTFINQETKQRAEVQFHLGSGKFELKY